METPARNRSILDFHRGLAAYAATPLVACPELAVATGMGTVTVKDESSRFGLNSFKVLGASWAMSRMAENDGPPAPVAAATAGNHGRAVAWMARQMGLRAFVFVPSGTSLRAVRNIRQEGAEIRIVPGNYEDAVSACECESRRRGWRVVSDTAYPGCTEMPCHIVEGYRTLFEECEEQLPKLGLPAPDVVLVQAGVGGLLSAAVHHYRARGDRPWLVSVQPAEASALLQSIRSPGGQRCRSTGARSSIMSVLNCAEVSMTAWSSIRSGVDLFLAIDDEYALAAVRRLRDSGVAAGVSGAAGLAGLLALGGDARFAEAKSRLGLTGSSHAMVINTEGPLEVRKMARE